MVDEREINKLVINIAKGNISSLDRLYEIMAGYIIVIGRRYVGRDNENDILQDTFLRIAQKADKFYYGSAYRWIIKICKNICLDYIKKNKNFTFTDEFHTMICSVDEFIESDDSYDINKAFKSLSEDELNVIFAYYYEYKTIKDISIELNMKRDTVYKIHTRAVNKIKSYIE